MVTRIFGVRRRKKKTRNKTEKLNSLYTDAAYAVSPGTFLGESMDEVGKTRKKHSSARAARARTMNNDNEWNE